MLTQTLSAPTNGSDWNVLSTVFPDEFSIYIVYNASLYSGTLVSINDGTMNELSVSVNSSLGGDPLLTLGILLPGLADLVVFDIQPEDSQFQFLGIAVVDTVLSVYLNCTLVGTTRLSSAPDPLVVSQDGIMSSEVEIFDNPGTVRAYFVSHP